MVYTPVQIMHGVFAELCCNAGVSHDTEIMGRKQEFLRKRLELCNLS